MTEVVVVYTLEELAEALERNDRPIILGGVYLRAEEGDNE